MTSHPTNSQGDFPQRRSFRCGIPAGQQTAVLEAGQWAVTVQLLNESAEGIAVWADQELGVRVDDVVWLATSFGRFEARVVYVTQGEPSAGERGGEKPGFRLGLEWLPELAAPPVVQSTVPETTLTPLPCPPDRV